MQEYLPERTDGSGAAKAGVAGDFSGWLGSDLLEIFHNHRFEVLEELIARELFGCIKKNKVSRI